MAEKNQETRRGRVRDEILALLLGASCAGCGRAGMLLCEGCQGELRAVPRRQRTTGGLPVVVALRYEGVAARCIRALKEEGMTMLAKPLGAAFAAAWAIAETSDVTAVCVPTSVEAFRRRGYRVPDLLLRPAGLRPARVLVPVRRVADQRQLGRAEREGNVRGSLRAIKSVSGLEVLLVDDVVTTGATLDESARALREAGARVRGAVVLAGTPAGAKTPQRKG